jgi:hypothetical protein
VKPLTGATVIAAVAESPALIVRLVVLVAMVKSTNVKVAVAARVRVPSVPDTVTVYVAAAVEVQDSVAVPEPVMVAGAIAAQVSPAGTVSLRVTVPVNPFTPVTVIVETAEEPALTAAGLDAATVKSVNRNVAVAE